MYKLIGQNGVKRLVDDAYIPLVEGNVDYEEYKQWLAGGSIPEQEFTEVELVVNGINSRIAEAKSYLVATDFYMTVDKYETLTVDKQVELKLKRAEARELINSLELELVEVING